jgi:hypothetical protein
VNESLPSDYDGWFLLGLAGAECPDCSLITYPDGSDLGELLTAIDEHAKVCAQ